MSIKLTREFAPADRYRYDFKYCTYANGWAQVDTRQDASYFGTWTNPYTLKIFNYCEGDTCLTECETADDYRQAIGEMHTWNKDAGYWLGIDPGLNDAMKARFAELGLTELLH